MELLQHFECVIDEVNEGNITVTLHDITHGFPEEWCEIPLKSIEKTDYDLLEPGYIFDWYLGYETPEDAEIEAVTSLMKFRRETLTPEEVAKAEFETNELINDA